MASANFLASYQNTTASTVYTVTPTFSSVAYDRHVLIFYRSIYGGTATAPTSVTVSGVAATLLYSNIMTGNLPLAIAIGVIPARATSSAISITQPTATVRRVLSLYMLDGIDADNATYSVATTVSGSTISNSITAIAPYFVVGAVSARLTGLTTTFSTLSHDNNISTTNLGQSVGNGYSTSGTYSDTATPSGVTNVAYVLVALPATTSGGNIKVWNGSTFVTKPVKVWDGSSFVAKPVKYWDGTSWTITPY